MAGMPGCPHADEVHHVKEIFLAAPILGIEQEDMVTEGRQDADSLGNPHLVREEVGVDEERLEGCHAHIPRLRELLRVNSWTDATSFKFLQTSSMSWLSVSEMCFAAAMQLDMFMMLNKLRDRWREPWFWISTHSPVRDVACNADRPHVEAADRRGSAGSIYIPPWPRATAAGLSRLAPEGSGRDGGGSFCCPTPP